MTKHISLTRGQVATVCDCHYHLVAPFKWTAHWIPNTRSYRAVRNESTRVAPRGTLIYMHAVVNDTPPGMMTDHIDGDTLNNCCWNLRTATDAQNLANMGKRRDNTSGFKGVWKHRDKWTAEISFQGQRRKLGTYATPELAARVYDAAARRLHGQFAHVNFPEEPSPDTVLAIVSRLLPENEGR